MASNEKTLELLSVLHQIYDKKTIATKLNHLGENGWDSRTIYRILKGRSDKNLNQQEMDMLNGLLPKRPLHYNNPEFTFIDLFAGIGGIRRGFEAIGGQCVFTSELDKFAVRTYMANYYDDPEQHRFNRDIRDITLTRKVGVISETQAYQHINKHIPCHDVLLAGFPCQPFSVAGVSKKKSLGRAHGFECETQGTLFFDVCRVIRAKQPSAFVLENVKNLRFHNQGKTFTVIAKTLDELGYTVADIDFDGPGEKDPKVINSKLYLPQHRERIVLVGFRKDLNLAANFSLKDIDFPNHTPEFGELLNQLTAEEKAKYTLSPCLWKFLYYYAKKHKAQGNGFGYGLIDPTNPRVVARTLSARYYKDGSEILIDQGWNKEMGEHNFSDRSNLLNRPRKLMPKECARLMGFDKPGESHFVIPVSDTQVYRQLGNSVVVPVFVYIAQLMKSRIIKAVELNKANEAEKQQAA
ncbi:MAG: DNA (cytosine-5)-methyltransferase 1 [Phenylobacterium sp.]|jgi:DNA (cytosine-5)-methyltransferase 1